MAKKSSAGKSASKAKVKATKSTKAKPAAKKMAVKKTRSLNVAAANPSAGAPAKELDVKRRLGNFGGAGEHPRQGGRTSGIVGQTKRQNKTDKGGKRK